MKDKSSIRKQLYPLAMAYAFVLAALFILGSGMSFQSESSTTYQEDSISQQSCITQQGSGHQLTHTDQWPDVDLSSAPALYTLVKTLPYTFQILKTTGERHAPLLSVKRFILYSCLKLGDYKLA